MNLDNAFSPFPTIKTERLILRQIYFADAADLFTLYSDPQVMAGHGATPYTQVEQATMLIQEYGEFLDARKGIRWAITQSDEGKLVGTCGFHHLAVNHYRGEIGYELARPYWRQGIMQEAVQSIIRFGFEKIGFHRIEAIVAPHNLASAELLRKVGFTEEGFLRERFFEEGQFTDDWVFSILKPEFEGQKTAKD